VYRAHWVRLTTWQSHRISGSRLGLRLLVWREPTVVATLVGTNLASVFAAVLFSRFCVEHFGSAYAAVAIVVVVALTLVFGEFLPKAYANARPNQWLRRSSWPLAASLVLFAPAVLVLEGIARVFATPLAPARQTFSLTRQDFLSALRQRERTAADKPAGQPISSLAARLFRFSRMKVSEAQIPIEQVQSVPEDASLTEILSVIERHGFSRIPVYRGQRENVVGAILAKDILAAPVHRVRRLERVAGDTRVMEELGRMQRRGEHMAAVVDKRERVTGIVTLEDILEELVGEIRSED
jgi:CBS domain containing-hemolysin-like protein